MQLKKGDWVYVSDESVEDASIKQQKRIYIHTNNRGIHYCVVNGDEGLYLQDELYDLTTWRYIIPAKEEKMDEREEALKRIEVAEKEIAAIKKILNSPKRDPRIGKLCKVWNCDDEPNNVDCTYAIVSEIGVGEFPFRSPNECATVGYKYARLLNEEEKKKYF